MPNDFLIWTWYQLPKKNRMVAIISSYFFIGKQYSGMYDITPPAIGVSMTVQNKFIKMPLVFRNYFFKKKNKKQHILAGREKVCVSFLIVIFCYFSLSSGVQVVLHQLLKWRRGRRRRRCRGWP